MLKLADSPLFLFWSRIASLVGALTAPLATLVVMMLFQRLASIEYQLEQSRIEKMVLTTAIAKMEGRLDGLITSIIRVEAQIDRQYARKPE